MKFEPGFKDSGQETVSNVKEKLKSCKDEINYLIVHKLLQMVSISMSTHLCSYFLQTALTRDFRLAARLISTICYFIIIFILSFCHFYII